MTDVELAAIERVNADDESANGGAWPHGTIRRLVAEVRRLNGEVSAYERLRDLWNKGMESTCDDRDTLKQEVRRLRGEKAVGITT